MRTTRFLMLVTERSSNKAHALYHVTDSGHTRLVRVDINLDGLATLAGKACDNPTGEATLHFRDIIAKVQ